MIEISKIEVNSYNIPLPEPVEAFAAGVMKAFDLVVCKIISGRSRIIFTTKEKHKWNK